MTVEAGRPPPEVEADGPPPEVEADGPPPEVEADGPPPEVEADGPPPEVEADGPPPEVEADRPPPEMVGPTPTRPAFVRPAVAGDEAILARLRDQALADIRLVRGGAMYLERHATELPPLPLQRGAFADETSASRRVWLGGLEGVEVGYVLGAVAELASGATLGVIEGIYVDPLTRECGIGELMMSVAIDWFRGRDCVGVEATALPGARATKNFFEEHGLKARLLTVYRSLIDDDPPGTEHRSTSESWGT